jgi:hypothetical protein
MSGNSISWQDEVTWHAARVIPRSCVSAGCSWCWSPGPIYPSEFEAIRSIAGKLGIGSPETLRKWGGGF